jgi:protein-S-isoprenylcysteine O-methyltransferase Ste14
MSIRRSVGAYFALQGLAVALWWFVLLLYPASREYFRMGDSDATLLAFWLPDLLLLATCSLLASLFSFKGSDHLLTVLYFVCGATAYAALYCVAFALLTDTAWLGVTLMVPAMILSFLCTVAVSPLHTWAFRQARPAHVKWNTTKTVAQIVVFWSSLLFIAPFVITLIEERIGLPRLSFAFQRPLATCFFLCFSVLGLWSGLTMARVGQGTPLPLDSPRRLVVSGPYAFVRNPMAIAGLGQGFLVALWCGSALVFAYVVAGVWTWQFLARPLEEDDMRRLFSRDFEEYSSHVRCWWPRRAPYRVTSALEGNAGSAILRDSAGSSSCEPGVTRRSDAALP